MKWFNKWMENRKKEKEEHKKLMDWYNDPNCPSLADSMLEFRRALNSIGADNLVDAILKAYGSIKTLNDIYTNQQKQIDVLSAEIAKLNKQLKKKKK
jgi:hypothetical protein